MAIQYKDYYQILGVPRGASDADIKRAFRRLARQHHPDVAKDKRGAEERFKEINEAYEVLGNPHNRKKYDRLGADWRAGAEFRPPPGWRPGGRGANGTGGFGGGSPFEFRFGGTGFSDFFEQFFGRSGRFRQAGGFGDFEPDGFEGEFESASSAHRGADVEGSILVTLEEVLRGSVRSISLRWTNPHTGGAESRTIKVRIPPGVGEGQRIRVAGRGETGIGGGGAGDLYLRVRLAAHPDFRIQGHDLYHDLDLAPWEAVLGATVSVPTLDGGVSLRIPPGAASGQQLRVRGRGLPRGADGGRGDLYVVLAIQVPGEVSASEKALWQQLARESRFDPRSK
ncbi:MAG TPA: J domain-containing protein [Candidatus Paceibacterota bacterium]|nr:J domain-containing protein [Candidatus Paceibacterota bacterium]HRZ54828.1 J domain-containing protein [Candidatus Paceibacterota bacterium]